MNEIIRSIEEAQLRKDLPQFVVGDTVRVHVKVVEGSRERLQAFEGVVIARRNGSARETFTVRRTSYGVGVERTFPLHSPRLDHIEVIRHGKVRRAKLYYLRERSGKAAKDKDKEELPQNRWSRALQRFLLCAAWRGLRRKLCLKSIGIPATWPNRAACWKSRCGGSTR